jgi:hypothetical protein
VTEKIRDKDRVRETDKTEEGREGRGDENTIQFCLKLRQWHASQIAKAGVHRGG